MAELSREIRRQVGILVNRFGEVEYVIVGDERSIFIPEMADYPLGKKRLRGLRLIHTHLHGEPLTDDDLTDLAMLRFDLIAALLLHPDDPHPAIQIASLTPSIEAKIPYQVETPQPLSRLRMDFSAFVAELEISLEKALKGGKEVRGGEERGILISVARQAREEAEDSLEELKELARTAGVEVLDTVIQRPRQFNARYLMGEGKMREVVIRALQLGATLLVFDQELSPAQVRSISALTELKVIDRSQLILDIFARRARSLDGKVQVELAQLKYLLPRLSGRGVQMSRLMGGIGGRGPGETKLEIDRRRIRDRIAKLERELEELSSGRYQRRQKRVRAGLPIVSIVGYTNAGKSTLLNTLTRSAVFTENLLFATLDTSTRRLRFPREREVIVTDTVGFHPLPPQISHGGIQGHPGRVAGRRSPPPSGRLRRPPLRGTDYPGGADPRRTRPGGQTAASGIQQGGPVAGDEREKSPDVHEGAPTGPAPRSDSRFRPRRKEPGSSPGRDGAALLVGMNKLLSFLRISKT